MNVTRWHRMAPRDPRMTVDSYLQMLQRTGLTACIQVVAPNLDRVQREVRANLRELLALERL